MLCSTGKTVAHTGKTIQVAPYRNNEPQRSPVGLNCGAGGLAHRDPIEKIVPFDCPTPDYIINWWGPEWKIKYNRWVRIDRTILN